MLNKKHIKYFNKILPKDFVFSEPGDCWAYGYDNSKMHVMPECVLFANHKSQIKNIVKYCFENNIPIGAIRVSSFNGYINEYSIIRSERDTKEKLYSQDLLKWKIIEWGLENNFSYYDLSGINLNPNNIKEKGIFRYKQKWGGKLTKYNIIK